MAVAGLLLLSLILGPFINALTHGPGVIVTEMEHLAWHAERGGGSIEEGHHHHDASDHDHVTPAILLREGEMKRPAVDLIEIHERHVGISLVREALRRPPRATEIAS